MIKKQHQPDIRGWTRKIGELASTSIKGGKVGQIPSFVDEHTHVDKHTVGINRQKNKFFLGVANLLP